MPLSTVPASYFVTVNPNVLAAGGNGLALIGLALTTSWRVPIGTVQSFINSTAVNNFFGATSAEANAAAVYFGGFTNSNIKPGSMLFAQYPIVAVAAWLRGGNVGATLTLVQLKALSADTLTVTTNGTPLTSASINLSAATSYSNAATIIQAAFTAPPFAVTYDSVSGAFVFTTTATGSIEIIGFATSGAALAAELLLTSTTGATISNGAAAATPAAFMASVIAITTDWATFWTLFNPDVSGNTNKLAFAQWVNTTNDEFIYSCWDTDITPTTTVPATASLGYLLSASQLNESGTVLIYDPNNNNLTAFFAGLVASIDFTQKNGNVNPAYKSQTGLIPSVTSEQILSNLQQNGYSCYVSSATAAQGFDFFYNGAISGPFIWAQPYINQIWLNSQFQLDLMLLLTQVKSNPYNASGDTMIEAALMSTISQALNFGMIQPGVPLSSLEVTEVNSAAGIAIDGILSTRGWYLQVLTALPSVRQARTSPPCNFWYMDGGSVNQITLASIALL